MQHVRERLAVIFWRCPWDPVELGVGIFLLLVGGWYALPFSTFSVSTSYRWAQTWLPEEVLGWVMLVLGLATIAATMAGQLRARLIVQFAALWLLLFMGWLLILSAPASAGLAIFGSLALAPGWAWWRLKRDAQWRSHRNGFPSSPR